MSYTMRWASIVIVTAISIWLSIDLIILQAEHGKHSEKTTAFIDQQQVVSSSDASSPVRVGLDWSTKQYAAQFHDPAAFQQRANRASHPYVALYLTGNARSFIYPSTYKRMKKNLVDSLSRNTLVFARLKTWDTRVKNQTRHGYFAPMITNYTAVRRAIRHLSPVHLSIEKAHKNSVRSECVFSKKEARRSDGFVSIYFGEAMIDRFVGQMKAVYDCYQDVVVFENLAGFKFDAIVRARPDVVWIAPSANATSFLARGHVIHLFDEFIFTPRAFSAGLIAWYNAYLECNGVWNGSYNPEGAFFRGFADLGVRYRSDRNIPMVIRRDNQYTVSAEVACGRMNVVTGRECKRLVYQMDDPN